MDSGKSIGYILKYTAQKRICTIWFIASFIIIILFVIFSITDRFGEQGGDAWQWILQQILPILTLIAGVFVNTSRRRIAERKVKKFYFKLAVWTSVGYFVLLAITILGMPFAYIYAELGGYDFLKQSSVYLIPVLAIVTTILGIFFTIEES